MTIITKQSNNSGIVPTVAQITTGELAVNTVDARLFIKKGAVGSETIVSLPFEYNKLTNYIANIATSNDFISVFVYDTRNDSDYGAWTQRISGSWYWESPSTTRGSTRKFPSVALIVARAASLTIYDAHDLDASGVPRMWMVFNAASGTAQYYGNGRAIFSLNGRLWWVGQYGLQEIDFANDRCRRWDATYRYVHVSPVAARTVGGWTPVASGGGGTVAIINADCFAVHAGVLPGAPLDSAGLPIPTVAVATAGGASVIHPWGVVYDVTVSGGYSRVAFLPHGRLFFGILGRTDYGLVPYADTTHSAWRSGWYDESSSALRTLPGGLVQRPIEAIGFGGASGLTLLSEDLANPSNGMTAFIAKDYATGWQPGDIRRAWLCDTITGSITGSAELVSNGDFAGGTTGWTASGSPTLAVVSGELEVTATGVAGPGCYQDVATVVGQIYLVGCVARRGTTVNNVVLMATAAGMANVEAVHGSTSNAPLMLQFTATATSARIFVYISGNPTAAATAYFDNISCRLALPDRSYKGKGLVVNGTLGRTALPCGLAAGGGFSAANYLEQPYSPDFDFGTGDFFVSGWFLHTAGGSIRTIADRAQLTSPYTNPFISLETSATDFPRMFIRDAGGTQNSVTSSVALGTNQWAHVAWISRGATLEMWVDGVRTATATRTATGSISNASAVLRVGLGVDGARPYPGSIAMLRAAAYAPTPAQIRHMYEDERVLILTGFPAVLGGTSSNVTALSANAAKNTLNVGTSDGVSTFSGIARLAYMDTASSTPAIANDAIVSVSSYDNNMLIATAANAGFIRSEENTFDHNTQFPSNLNKFSSKCVTTDATPTDMNPRIYVGEREVVTIETTVICKTYGSTSSQIGTYKRVATYVRNAGGNITISGSIQTIGTDQETTGGMDVTLQLDTSSQTVTPRVTGVAATRISWSADIRIIRISEENQYQETL